MSEKQYVGKGREFGNYGNTRISIKYDLLVPNAKGYVNLCIGNMREQDKFGNTKTVWVDDYVPQQKCEPERAIIDPDQNDLPF